MKTISKSSFPVVIKKRLIYCMLPCDIVPSTSVITALSTAGLHSVANSLKVELIKWILVVWEAIEPECKINLIYFYDLIFGFVNIENMSQCICQLLYRLTDTNTVTKLCIRKLIKLESRLGPQQHIVGLLSAFQAYRSDLVFVKTASATSLKPRMTRLARLFQRLQRNIANSQSLLGNREVPLSGGIKISNRGMIDESNVVDFLLAPDECKNHEWDSLSSILHSSLRPVLLSTCTDASIFIRLESRLQIEVLDEVISTRNFKRAENVLRSFLQLTKELQQGVHEIESFLCDYLKVWTGFEHENIIFELISWWHLCSFEELKLCVLEPLVTLAKQSTLEFQCNLLQCLRKLLENWVIFDCERHNQCVSKPYPSRSPLEKHCRGFCEEDETDDMLDPRTAIRSLIGYIGKLHMQLLIWNDGNDSSLLLYHVLRFYRILLDTKSLDLITAFPLTVYIFSRCVLSFNPFIFSEFCRLILMLREELFQGVGSGSSDIVKYTHVVNRYLDDTFCLLFSSEDLEQNFPVYNRGRLREVSSLIQTHPILFNIWVHPAVFVLSFTHMFELGLQGIPLQNLQLDTDNVEQIRQYFVENGLEGLVEVLDFMLRYV